MNEVKGVPINSMLMEITPHLFISTLKLFNAVPVKNQKRKKPTKEVTELTVNHGFILSPQLFANYSEEELYSIIKMASEEIALSPKQMNSSFHKSWKKVRDAPMFQLLVEQAFHYMTTYGYEELGVYDENSVYIPNERFDIPTLNGDVKLSIIKGYTKKQLKEKLLKLLNSGIALNSLEEIVEVAKFCKLTDDDVLSIKNKEVRIRLYGIMNIIPEDPTEFLRLMVFNVTGSSLIIINKKTIEMIKESETEVGNSFTDYDERFGYKRLAEIFLRFKPLFLAFKNNTGVEIINRISHLSHKYHKPMKSSMLNDITKLLKWGKKINTKQLKSELEHANIFRKIRLASALNYRTTGSSSILYKVRNGKGYAKELHFHNIEGARKTYDIILKSIIGDLKHLKGKKIHIPENIRYALPATVKQFTGNIPSGSYVIIPKDMLFGVYWDNVNGHRIDLDLSVISIENGKIGWDSQYRTNNVLFSGDVTDASGGASELFYVSKHYEDTLLLYVNYFNYNESVPVPFKIMVGEEHPNSFGRNYMIDPNHIACVAKTEINIKQKILGLAKITNGECRFYFSETGLGNSITSGDDKHNDLTRDYLSNYVTNMITLNDVLDMAGAKIVNEKGKDIIDLSPESIEKDSFIRLLVNHDS